MSSYILFPLEKKNVSVIVVCSCLDYNQAHQRHYEKQVKQMKPDLEAYEKQKQEM